MRASMSLKTVLFSGTASPRWRWPAPPRRRPRRPRRRRPAAAQATETAPSDQRERDIVVTGTRVVRDGYQAPTPLTVLTTEDIQNTSPTNNIADFVNQLPSLGRLDPAVQLAPQHQQRPGRHQRPQPAQFRRDPHPHPAQRPAIGRLDDHRRGRRQHDPANARRAGRDRHRRRLGGLWLGRGRRRGQLHPRQRLRGPADRGGYRRHRRGATGSIIRSAPRAAFPSPTAAAV